MQRLAPIFRQNSLENCMKIVKKLSNLYWISYLRSSPTLPKAIRLRILVSEMLYKAIPISTPQDIAILGGDAC